MRNCLLLLIGICSTAVINAQLPRAYNIVWTTQSKNPSESMPCGGHSMGLNVWVEKGDLLIYANQSGALNEDNNLMKAGRIRLQCSPNPFDGKIFKQELHLQEGYITVEGENNGIRASARIWVNAFEPIAHIDITASKKINVEASYESWRYKERPLVKRENYSNSWKWMPPANKTYSRDSIEFWTGIIRFHHNNGPRTIFDSTVAYQGMSEVKKQLYDPLKNRVFGGVFGGRGFEPAGIVSGVYEGTDFMAWKLKSSKSASKHQLKLVLCNSQDQNTETSLSTSLWYLKAAMYYSLEEEKTAFTKTLQWWKEFWSRSFIYIDNNKVNSSSWSIARNYQLFRYQLGCNAKGEWPTKFNGGLFTVDPHYTDSSNKGLSPDYRNWGGGVHTAQNQRLVYFPMIKSGDFDLLQSQLEFYLRIQKNAELRSKVNWNHEGACFTEQMENYGLPNIAEYGSKRPADFDKGVEYNAWLEYEWDTVFEFCLMMLQESRYTGKDISSKVPFIMSCLRFFDEHYKYLARKRGIKELDGNGQLVLYPGSAGETYKMANNASSTIAALQTVSKELVDQLQQRQNDPVKDSSLLQSIQYLHAFIKRIPPLNYRNINGHSVIAPAKTWERINNEEPMALYPVFPWGIYGVGKPGLDTALNTWNYDPDALRFRSHKGWKQDNIWAARLGLREEAWRLNELKLADAPRRFPSFWGPGFDWVPDHNWGGSGMIGLQEMLLQTDGKRILLFPAWPKDKDVHFKLHAPYNTTVEAEWKNGRLEMLKVLPEERRGDVEVVGN